MTNIPAAGRLIVALDVDTAEDAWNVVKPLDGVVSLYKVGLQLFLREGMKIVDELIAANKKVFLDLKIDDTPRTVTEAVRASAKDGVEFFTLQGNGDTARAAKEGRGTRTTPKFLQVTFLSSWDTQDFKEHFNLRELQGKTIDDAVLHRTKSILKAGCEGVIASGSSVKKTRDEFGADIIIVTPGIRPTGSAKDDHKRSLTPADAIAAGADYLVVGRPIRNAPDKALVARSIIDEIDKAQKKRSTLEHPFMPFKQAVK